MPTPSGRTRTTSISRAGAPRPSAQELVARGVQRDRLAAEGFGKQRPVAPNTLADGKDNPAGRALNRRVEAVVQVTEGAPR